MLRAHQLISDVRRFKNILKELVINAFAWSVVNIL